MCFRAGLQQLSTFVSVFLTMSNYIKIELGTFFLKPSLIVFIAVVSPN